MTGLSRILRLPLVALVVALSLALVACSSSSESTTTTEPETSTTEAPAGDTVDQDLVFGKGEMPATIPQTFPIPEAAVVGSTMIDRTRSLTEAVVTFPANVPEVVTFFEANLEALGWTVESSAGTDADWLLEFSGELGSGEVILKTGGSGLTQGTVRFITPDVG